MTVRVEGVYEGNLRCKAVHGPSQDVLHTDAPTDNHGAGAHFSPTDLLATALGTCMLTTMALAAQGHNINVEGATVSVDKEMGATPRRHVQKLTVRIALPVAPNPHDLALLHKAAHDCPVAVSLAAATEVDLQLTF